MQRFSPTKLKALREARGLSRQQLAFAIRMNVDHVGAYERGRNVPRIESLVRLCEGLGCQPEDLYEDFAVAVGTGLTQRKETAESPKRARGTSRAPGHAAVPARSRSKAKKS